MRNFINKVAIIFADMITVLSIPRRVDMKKIQVLLVVLALAPTSAFAYIGPGAGLGAIVTFIAIALGMLLLVAGFLWYPLKRMLRKRRETEKKWAPS